MLHELRTYTLSPGGVPEYLRLYEEEARAVQSEILGHLVCLLQPESGNLNQLRFLWRFYSFEDRRVRRERLLADARFTAFRKSVKHLLVSQESQILRSL